MPKHPYTYKYIYIHIWLLTKKLVPPTKVWLLLSASPSYQNISDEPPKCLNGPHAYLYIYILKLAHYAHANI